MKKFNKLVSFAVASAMVLAMAGCGGQTNSPSSESGSSSAAAGSESSGSASTGSEGSFKIGGIGPITGAAAIYGTNVRNAAQIAVDEINAAGGVNGYQLELNFQDDEHDAEKAVNAYNTLKDWGAQMILGAVTSTPCIAVTGETMADNMFQLTPSGSAVDCAKYDNNFRLCFSDPDQGAASAQYIGENNLATKVAIICDTSNVYSTGIRDSFLKGAADQPFEVVAQLEYTADTNQDFSVQIQKAQEAGADLIFLPMYYEDASRILTQSDAAGYHPSFFSCDGMDGILTVENFDTSLAEGVMLLTPFAADAQDEKTQNFVAAYEKAYGETPNQFAADGYDCVYAIKAALEASNATPDMSVSDLCEALKSGMTSITLDGLTGEGMTWNEAGEPSKAPKAVKIVNGAYTAM